MPTPNTFLCTVQSIEFGNRTSSMNLLLAFIIILVLILVWYTPIWGMRLKQYQEEGNSREHLEELEEKLVQYLPYAQSYYPTSTGIVYRQK